MIATRGFVRTPQSSRARLSLFPTDAEALRVGHPQIRLVLICVLVCRGYCIPCSDCSSFDLRMSLLIPPLSKRAFACSIVLCCAAQIATEAKPLLFVPVVSDYPINQEFMGTYPCRDGQTPLTGYPRSKELKIRAAIMPLVLSASRGSQSPQKHSATPPAKPACYY